MSTPGQAIGAVVGGVVGAFFGPMGFVMGVQLGAMLGGFIDPPKADEPDQPQKQELQYNTFAHNLPVPVIYGTRKIAGNIIWIGNARSEVVERESEGAGKGAPDPPKIKEVWYYADFGIALSEGQITSVDKVFLDDEDITTQEGLNYTAYLGTTSQNADSHVITALGVVAAPAFRNLAYLLMSGSLGQANRLPIVSSIVTGIVAGESDAWALLQDTGVAVDNNLGTALIGADGKFYVFEGTTENQGSKVFRSDDNGVTWSNVGTVGSSTFIAVEQGATLYAGDWVGPQVRKSTDNGATWTMFQDFVGSGVHASKIIQSITWRDANVVGVLVSGGVTAGLEVWISENAGGSWAKKTIPSPHDIESEGTLLFVGNTLVLGGEDGEVLTSSDLGANWTSRLAADGQSQWCRGFAQSSTVAVLTNPYQTNNSKAIARTADGGATWSTINGPADWGVYSTGAQRIVFESATVWYMSGPSGQLLVAESTDAGLTWASLPTPPAAGGTLVYGGGRLFLGANVDNIAKFYVYGTAIPMNNPAWAVRDLLLNTRYGLGLSADKLDEASFQVAAAFCDEQVTTPAGTEEDRFQIGYILDSQRPVLDHLRDMLATFRGFLAWSQGTVKLRIEKDEAVSQAFNMNSIVTGSFQWRKQSYRDRPNVLRIEYINAADDYRHDYVEAFDTWDIDTMGERRERVVRLLGVTRATQAQRMALFYLDQAIHVNHLCSFRVGIGALKAEVGDVISVTHDVPSWSAKEFRILQIEEAEDDELALTCVEHNADIYHDEGTAIQEGTAEVLNAYAIPYHVSRLSAQKLPGQDVTELSYTRVQTSDLFAGTFLYRRRAAGDFALLETAIAPGPTAYLNSQVSSLTHVATGSPAVGAGFTDSLSRTNAASLGDGWNELVQIGVWGISGGSARRGDPSSGSPTGDAVARTTSMAVTGDVEVSVTLLDASRVGSAAQVGLAARWQTSAGSAGQFYAAVVDTQTRSGSVLSIGLYRVTSGGVWTTLSTAAVNSGAYFTEPGSPSTLALRVESYTLTALLNNSAQVTAVDSWLSGEGQAALVRRSGPALAFPDRLMTLRPVGYWRLGEAAGVNTATDHANAWHGTYVAASGGATGLLGGDADTAAVFNGTSGHVAISSAFHVRSAMTLVALIRVQSLSNPSAQQMIASKRNTDPGSEFSFCLRYMQESRHLNAFITGATLANVAYSVTSMNWNTTYTVGMTYDVSSSVVAVYVNGSREGTCSYSTIMTSFTSAPLAFGRQFHATGDNFFKGTIDEVAIFDRALSADEMLLLHHTALGSLTAGRGERWQVLEARALSTNSPVLVRGVPDGWSLRVFNAGSSAVGQGVASAGAARASLAIAVGSQPFAGWLTVYTDGTGYSERAAWGTLSHATIRGGDEYLFDRDYGFVTATQTSIPIFGPLGGFSAVGSLRLRAEQFGYSTFADSLFTGVARGAGGSTATSHTNAVSLNALVVESGGVGSSGLITVTAAATDPASNIVLFPSNSMHVYYGASSRFARLSQWLARNSTQVLSLAAEYSTGDGTWASLVASGFFPPTDGTSGFTVSGDILIEPPGNWSPTNRVTSGGAALADSTSYYYLRLRRTTATVSTAPTELQALLDGDLVAAGRTGASYQYTHVAADSGQALSFKAITVGIRGQMADGTKAPVTAVAS